MPTSPRLQELYEVVSKIPPGSVASYGAVGRALSSPVSGLVAGRWMHVCPPEIPWWRVIGADGTLKTEKKGPEVAQEQRRLLEKEGVVFDSENRVEKSFFLPCEALI